MALEISEGAFVNKTWFCSAMLFTKSKNMPAKEHCFSKQLNVHCSPQVTCTYSGIQRVGKLVHYLCEEPATRASFEGSRETIPVFLFCVCTHLYTCRKCWMTCNKTMRGKRMTKLVLLYSLSNFIYFLHITAKRHCESLWTSCRGSEHCSPGKRVCPTSREKDMSSKECCNNL